MKSVISQAELKELILLYHRSKRFHLITYHLFRNIGRSYFFKRTLSKFRKKIFLLSLLHCFRFQFYIIFKAIPSKSRAVLVLPDTTEKKPASASLRAVAGVTTLQAWSWLRAMVITRNSFMQDLSSLKMAATLIS